MAYQILHEIDQRRSCQENITNVKKCRFITNDVFPCHIDLTRKDGGYSVANLLPVSGLATSDIS